jgi:hypothetical protein
MAKYLRGFTNYSTHAEAERAFENLRTEQALSNNVVINLMDTGTATINYLQDKPMYQGQVEYIGNK